MEIVEIFSTILSSVLPSKPWIVVPSININIFYKILLTCFDAMDWVKIISHFRINGNRGNFFDHFLRFFDPFE